MKAREEKKKTRIKIEGEVNLEEVNFSSTFSQIKKKTIAISISIPFHQMNQVRNMKLPTNIGN